MTAVIRETTDTRGIRVCGGDGRERDVYTTVTNAVEVRMRGPQSRSTEGGHYLMKYTGRYSIYTHYLLMQNH